jgi:tRNA/tmRNA/rRNA uracil-C5-methylase (TrmA/RlmC/RlmD family)
MKQNNNIQFLPIVGSPQDLGPAKLGRGYRNKIEFSFGKYITNDYSSPDPRTAAVITLSNRSVGFHKQGEFSKIIDIENCGLISDKANEIFAYIKKLCFKSGLPVYDQKTHQ